MAISIGVLAVDDDETNLNLIKDYLVDYMDDGVINLTTAMSAAQALKVLDSGRSIELILLDHMMPDMTGLELLSILKKHPSFKDIPVILQTASSDRETVKKAAELGTSAYLVKPYFAADLIEKISACVSWLPKI